MENKVKNLGIFGGTFDPIHLGHIGCAEAAADAFNIDQIWFMPANHPNFKQDDDICDIAHRIKMCELALKDHGNDKFCVSDIEAKREGITYTSDTLEILHSDYPDTNLFFITGSDAVFGLSNWHNADKILELATIIAVTRKGFFKPSEQQNQFLDEHSQKIKLIEADVIGASSSEIRQLICEHKNIESFVPKSVIEYIAENNLY